MLISNLKESTMKGLLFIATALLLCMLFRTSFAEEITIPIGKDINSHSQANIVQSKRSQDESSYEKIISNQNEVINKLIISLQSKEHEKVETDYSGWVSILLGCVGIIITVVSVVVAIVSLVGYRNFQKKIENTVKTISSKIALEETTNQLDIIAKKELARLLDEGLLNKHLQDAVNLVFLRSTDSKITNGFEKYPELDIDEENHS